MSMSMIFPPNLTKPFLSSPLKNQTFVPLRQSHTKPISACFKQHNFAGSMNGRRSSSMFLHGDNRKTTVPVRFQDEATATPEPKDGDHNEPSESSLLKKLQDYKEKLKDGICQVPMMLKDEDTITCLCNILSDLVSVLASNKLKIVYSVLKNGVSLGYKKWKHRNLSTQKPDDVEGVDAELKQTTSMNPQCEEGTAIEDGAQELVEMEDDFMEFGSQN